MSSIGNSLLRGVVSRRLQFCLQPQAKLAQINIQRSNYATTVVTSKDVKPPTNPEQKERLNNAARIFLERSREYDEMIDEARSEYKIGMRHLANMMGVDPESFTQEDANAAIEYLFPSGLYDKKARPFMKPPEEVFPPRKKIQFDMKGRPFHYQFFTGFPNYYDLCHEAVELMKKLDKIEDKDIRQNKEPNEGLKLNLSDSAWLPKDELQNKIIEDITDKQYADFVAMMDRLLKHPYSYQVKDFIMSYRKNLIVQYKGREIIEPKTGEDGRKYVTTYECRSRTCLANVTVISPGTGVVEINGKDINFFEKTEPKETLLFPLHFTDMLGKVDIKAETMGGGYMGQANAIRFGISLGLRSFVDEDTVECMRVAGLLTADWRRKERKKFGQEGARRKFTWKKR